MGLGYSVREKISKLAGRFETNVRFWVRRRYLRNDIDKFHFERKLLSKKQKRAIRAYWRPYTKHICYKWHSFYYSLTGNFDVRYIPEDIMMTEIEGYLNDWNSAHGVDNKNNYQFYFSDVKQPQSVFHKMRGIWHLGDYQVCSFDEAVDHASNYKMIVTKYALDAGKGASLKFWRQEEGKEALIKLMHSLPADAVGQVFISQHPQLAAFNPSSVNSIRIVTLIFENDIHVLAAYLRMGQDGALLDNVCAGGICCSILPNGELRPFGYDKHAKQVNEHPSGIRFAGFRVPGYENVVNTAKMLHSRVGNFRIISWDFAVDEDEQPVFIEMNLKYGAMEYHQLQNGPLFGDMTDRLLNEVYGKVKK